MNEKELCAEAYQSEDTVIAKDQVFTRARLVEYDGKKYAVNPQAMLTINCTSRCNANCFFCYNRLTFMRDEAYVSWDTPQLERAMEFARRAGIRTVTLTGGEPTLDPKKLLGLLKKSKEKGFSTVRLHTNGVLLNQSLQYGGRRRPLWKHLAEGGLDELSISIADYRPERNRQIMKIDNLSWIQNYPLQLTKQGISVRFSCYLCSQGVSSAEEIQQYLTFAKEQGVSNVIFRIAPEAGKKDREYLAALCEELKRWGWRQGYHHEKSDSIIYEFKKEERSLTLSDVREETDPDAKIRRLIYMPDQVVYTSWLDPSSYLFPDDAQVIGSFANQEIIAADHDYPGNVWNKSTPEYLFWTEGQTIDLHVHSLVSDGLCTPSEVLKNAAKAGIKTLVFAEHNCLHDFPEKLIRTAAFYGVKIPMLGVEFSTVYCVQGVPDMKFHLLIYGKRPEQFDFMNQMYCPNEPRNAHLRKLYEQALRNHLLDETWEDIYEIADREAPSEKKMFIRTPLAQTIARRCRITLEQAKERYLPPMPDEERYREYLDTAKVIAAARKNGCVAVLAHPGWIRAYEKGVVREEADLFAAITDLAKHGLDGIEISHRLNSSEMREKLYRLCVKLNLIPTGGSDYHGKPLCVFGVNGTTRENLHLLMERLK